MVTSNNSIDRLAEVKKPRLRIFLLSDLAFIYDPLMLESPPDSLLVAWGESKQKHWMNGYVRAHIEEHGNVFHTFARPRQRVRAMSGCSIYAVVMLTSLFDREAGGTSDT